MDWFQYMFILFLGKCKVIEGSIIITDSYPSHYQGPGKSHANKKFKHSLGVKVRTKIIERF